MITYISYNQLMDDIRDNLWKIPRNTDLILAIPRSGTIVASIITKHLNLNMMMIQDFCDIIESGGNEADLKKRCYKGFSIIKDKPFKNILVIDDTIYSGRQMNKWREKLSSDIYSGFKFIFLTAYKEGTGNPDIFLRDISAECLRSKFKSCTYEWTLWYRYNIAVHIAYDLDGVLCVDPPDDHNKEAYENYLKNPIPLHTPVYPHASYKTTVITYRIDKYRELTADFLRKFNIYCTLYMVRADSREEREKLITPWDYKAQIYGSNDNLWLYIESNDYEAQMIHQLTKKPVLCISTNKLYQIED